MTSDGQPYAPQRYKEIIKEQVALSYYTKGGVSYSDSDSMTPYERKIANQVMREILDESAKQQADAIEKAKLRKNNESPKSGLYH